jgi:hypothetical protein
MTVAAALAFTWLGLVVGISFVEAPLKFRAPGITHRLGLGIGRLVFTALNGIEALLGVVIIVLVAISARTPAVLWAAGALIALLVVQLAAVRPVLNRRSDRVLAGEDVPRSRVHLVYIGFELAKVAALITFGCLALTSPG